MGFDSGKAARAITQKNLCRCDTRKEELLSRVIEDVIGEQEESKFSLVRTLSFVDSKPKSKKNIKKVDKEKIKRSITSSTNLRNSAFTVFQGIKIVDSLSKMRSLGELTFA